MSQLIPFLILLLTAAAPGVSSQPGVTQAKVDLVEWNHFLDDSGREVFQQVVFYDWSRTNRQFEVRAWRLIKDPSQRPRRHGGADSYLIRWRDKHVTREVLAKSMRRTWSQEDPERANRRLLPEDDRRPLFPAVSKR